MFFLKWYQMASREYMCGAIFVCWLALLFCVDGAAGCNHVYTIGAYDDEFSKQAVVTKLGLIAAKDIPPFVPTSFLEKDGSYGGGEAFCTIKQACLALKQQIASGLLPKNEEWHIYLLDADWNHDTYKLHANDFRITHAVNVLRCVRKNC